jgi:hypothetical protein
MKKYSSKSAKKGKVAYRTPARFCYQKGQWAMRQKTKKK